MKIIRLAFAALGLAACGGTVDSAPPQSVLYEATSTDDRSWRLVRAAMDGSQLQVLYEAPLIGMPDGFYPSPDGLSIIFGANTTSGWLLVPASGGTGTMFPAPPTASRPAWSPDAGSIAWLVPHPQRGSNQLVITASGSASGQVVTADSLQLLSAAQWSPDGSTLLFCAQTADDATFRFYTIGRTGNDLRQISPDSLWVGCAAAWSPLGDRIAFLYGEVYTSNPDGTGLQQLTTGGDGNGGGFLAPLNWSPDGRYLSAAGSRFGTLNRIDAATGARLSMNVGTPDASPWSPTGQWIMYPTRTAPDSLGNSRSAVGVMHRDATRGMQVSPDSSSVYRPAWLPEPQ